MNTKLMVLLVGVGIVLLFIIQGSFELKKKFEPIQSRLEVLSPKLKALIQDHDINYREKVDVVVSTGGLNSEALDLADFSPLKREGDFQGTISLNTVLNISTEPQILYIREADETEVSPQPNQE